MLFQIGAGKPSGVRVDEYGRRLDGPREGRGLRLGPGRRGRIRYHVREAAGRAGAYRRQVEVRGERHRRPEEHHHKAEPDQQPSEYAEEPSRTHYEILQRRVIRIGWMIAAATYRCGLARTDVMNFTMIDGTLYTNDGPITGRPHESIEAPRSGRDRLPFHHQRHPQASSRDRRPPREPGIPRGGKPYLHPGHRGGGEAQGGRNRLLPPARRRPSGRPGGRHHDRRLSSIRARREPGGRFHLRAPRCRLPPPDGGRGVSSRSRRTATGRPPAANSRSTPDPSSPLWSTRAARAPPSSASPNAPSSSLRWRTWASPPRRSPWSGTTPSWTYMEPRPRACGASSSRPAGTGPEPNRPSGQT